MLGRSLGMGLLLAALTGCDMQYIDFYSCEQPDRGHKDPHGVPDPCHRYQAPDGGADAGEDAGHPPPCEVGQYAHWLLPWQTPTLLWFGPPDQAPQCPLGPTTLSYEGHADLVAPSACEACTCKPPTGSCALPSTLTASTLACNIPGGATTSFNAPDPWDGSCDGTIQTPSGAAQSLTIDPIKMTENGCTAGPTIPAKVISLHWGTFARGCDVGLPTGPIERSVCLPDDPIEPGFKACIYSDDEIDCPNNDPSNVFTERHVFYLGVQDDRECSACTCGAPTGSACKAQVSIYDGNDLTCNGPTFAQISISSTKNACLDVTIPGQSLGGKSAGPTTYIPGTCPPLGGDSSGTAVPTHSATFCCRP